MLTVVEVWSRPGSASSLGLHRAQAAPAMQEPPERGFSALKSIWSLDPEVYPHPDDYILVIYIKTLPVKGPEESPILPIIFTELNLFTLKCVVPPAPATPLVY